MGGVSLWEGAWICMKVEPIADGADPTLQSHLCIEKHPVLPKQLLQLCFHWVRDRKDLRDI